MEAAEARETPGDGAAGKKKKKAVTAKAKAATVRRPRKKEKVQQRKRLMWVVYNAGMKEEARFPYDQRDEADKKAEQLRKKAGKLFFVQPVKENITDAPADEPRPKGRKAAAKVVAQQPIELEEEATEAEDAEEEGGEEEEED
ncbi:MAG: hypothetical protein WED34_11245 [Planctomycetales bacterium]